MLEPMTIWVEVWPVVADEAGLWLISGQRPLRDGPVMADSSVHFMVESLLRGQHIDPRPVAEGGDCLMLHSTSWRPDGPRQWDTYVAAVQSDDLALAIWPDAKPITPDLLDEDAGRGKPPTHGATEEPMPRVLDVLFHGLGHFRDQISKNGTARESLGELWRVQLEPFEETLAGMYSEPHRAA